MKIGIDCRLWSESGIGRYTRNLIEQLLIIDKKNKYTLLILSKDYDQIISYLSSLNFHLVKTDIRWHTIEEQLKFPQILNKENLDLIHFPYFSVPIFYNKPFVVTIHDLIMHHFPTGQASTHSSIVYKVKLLGYKHVISQAAKKAQKIIAVSNATRDEIVDHLKIDSKKIVVTYEGVDNKLSGNYKLEIGNWKLKNLPSKFFLYVGNAYPHKNLDRLLEAFKILNSDVGLVLVGKEDYFYKSLKEKVKNMGLDRKVIFFGQASDEELASLYANASAFITPSLMEGFCLPALEAMANRCLVLSSDIPALREVCGDAAIYFDPHNTNDMMEKMKEVCSGDNSDKKEKGLERANQFSWEKMAKETLKIYESCVSL
ncbi:MAG: glycosyltransferase family 1 protein [Candidatus Levybacteria bacterium]|nr:glycosyltransferase family 1 protein [Candidatus Levybacteria bacterium]